MRTHTHLARWTIFAVAYVVSLGLSVWLVVDAWEPADGPRWEQWAFALCLGAVVILLAVIAALPLWLGLPGPGWYVAAAAFAVASALAAAIFTFGLLFLPAVLLLVLAGANVYAALRIGGLGRAEAAVGIVALVALVWLTTGVYLPLVVLAAVVAVVILVAGSGRARVSRR